MTGHKAMGAHHSAKPGTTTWLTPPDLLAKLGGPDAFDLDPCAAVGQPWPTARTMFTEEDDGLAQDWRDFGLTFVNPPYTNSEIGDWMDRLAEHGDGIALIFARTETAVFHRTVWQQADAILFLEGRLHFHHIDGTRAKANAGAPSVLIAYGVDSTDIIASCDVPGAFQAIKLRAFTFGYAEVGSWVEEVRKVMERADRPMTVAQLYKCLADSPKARGRKHWREKVRQSLGRGPFVPKGGGVWELGRQPMEVN